MTEIVKTEHTSELGDIYEMLRVIVVDDHMMMRTLISNHLKDMKFKNVDTASGGVEALEKIGEAQMKGEPYHMVFLDWHMPDLEGIEVLKQARQNKQYDRMAIIMLTAEQEQKNILLAIQAGVTAYMVKPPTQEVIAEKLDGVLDWLYNKGLEVKKNKEEEKTSSSNPQSKEALFAELKSNMKKAMECIFSELFDVEYIPESNLYEKLDNSFICSGTFKKRQSTVLMRTLFSKDVLDPLLQQIHSPDFLEEDENFDDAAKKLTGSLCKQAQSFLNKTGCDIEFGQPETDLDSFSCEDAEFVINMCFSRKS